MPWNANQSAVGIKQRFLFRTFQKITNGSSKLVSSSMFVDFYYLYHFLRKTREGEKIVTIETFHIKKQFPPPKKKGTITTNNNNN